MLFGAFAAQHAGLATDVHTDWTLGEEASENACGPFSLAALMKRLLKRLFVDRRVPLEQYAMHTKPCFGDVRRLAEKGDKLLTAFARCRSCRENELEW